MKKILAIGEVIWDIYEDTNPKKQVIGGAPLNFAAHAKRCGAQSALISAVGQDDLGRSMLEGIDRFCVDRTYVKKNDKCTGQCLVTLNEQGVPRFNVLTDTAYDNIVLEEADYDAIAKEGFDALYFGTLIQRQAVSAATVRRLAALPFGEILCDVNLRVGCYDAASVQFCLCHATVLKVSIEEEPTLRSFGYYTPEEDNERGIARALCAAFPQLRVVILTLGKDGSYAYTASDGKEYRQGAVGDVVVSTVGAGDSFAAAFLATYLSGASMESCMKRASEVSGFVVSRTEAVPEYSL